MISGEGGSAENQVSSSEWGIIKLLILHSNFLIEKVRLSDTTLITFSSRQNITKKRVFKQSVVVYSKINNEKLWCFLKKIVNGVLLNQKLHL